MSRSAARLSDAADLLTGVPEHETTQEQEQEPAREQGSAEEHPRDGMFWEMVAGRVAPPAAAVTLGWQLRGIDPEAGTIEVDFQAGDHLVNPAGVIQGGFLAAMLDDTMGPALVATLPAGQFAPTLDLHVQFFRPARPGLIHGRGAVLHRGRAICFLSGTLTDPAGRVLAAGSATARTQPISR
jgi:uncharacterized protein (TIGR00369 family)